MACCRKHFASDDSLNINVGWQVSQIPCLQQYKVQLLLHYMQIVRIDRQMSWPADEVYKKYLELVSHIIYAAVI